MTYEELVAIVKDATKKRIVSKLMGHVAYQFNVEGEAEGAFYLEVAEGQRLDNCGNGRYYYSNGGG